MPKSNHRNGKQTNGHIPGTTYMSGMCLVRAIRAFSVLQGKEGVRPSVADHSRNGGSIAVITGREGGDFIGYWLFREGTPADAARVELRFPIGENGHSARRLTPEEEAHVLNNVHLTSAIQHSKVPSSFWRKMEEVEAQLGTEE